MILLLSIKNPDLIEEIKQKIWHYVFHFGNYSYAYFGKLHHILGHFWSLAVEEHFYLIWGAVMLYFRNNKKILIAILFIMIILPVLTRFLGHLQNVNPYIISFSTHNRIDSIAWGCLLAIVYPHLKPNTSWHNYLLLISTFLFFSIGLWITQSTGTPPQLKALDYTFLSIGSVCLILAILQNEGPLRYIFGSKFLAYLGILSYGVYMFHLLTHTIIFSLVSRFFPNTPHELIAVAAVLAPYVPVYFFYIFIDQYFLKLRKQVI